MFFDKFKKNKLENNINEENLNDIGWQAIEKEVKRVYGIDKPYVNELSYAVNHLLLDGSSLLINIGPSNCFNINCFAFR